MPSPNVGLVIINTFLQAVDVDEEAPKMARSKSDSVLHSRFSVNARPIYTRHLEALSASSSDIAPDSENTSEDESHETQPYQHPAFHPSSHVIACDANNLTSTAEDKTRQAKLPFPGAYFRDPNSNNHRNYI